MIPAVFGLIYVMCLVATDSSPSWLPALVVALTYVPAYAYQSSRSWPYSGGQPPGQWWVFCLLLLGFAPAAFIYRQSTVWRELSTEQSVLVLVIGVIPAIVIGLAVGGLFLMH